MRFVTSQVIRMKSNEIKERMTRGLLYIVSPLQETKLDDSFHMVISALITLSCIARMSNVGSNDVCTFRPATDCHV